MRRYLNVSGVIILWALALALPACLPDRQAWAQNAEVEGSKGQKKEEGKTLEDKKTLEKRKSTGKRGSTSDSSGKDKTASQAIRDVQQAQQQHSIDVSLSLDAVFLQHVVELEQTGQAPFAACRLATRPLLPADFGLTAQRDPRTIDTIMASWLQQAAASNAKLPDDAQIRILAYRDCLAQYGTIIADAYLNLEADLKEIKAQVVHDEKTGARSIKDLSLEDFQLLAADALTQAVTDVEAGDLNPQMQRTYTSLQRSAQCSWNGTVEKIRCGGALITLDTSPQLVFAGVPIYGQGGYFGFRAEYKLTNNYSLSNALEDLSQSSTFSKWAKEVSKYTEDLEAKGQLKDAVLARRNAVETMQNGKVGVGISHLLPSVHQ